MWPKPALWRRPRGRPAKACGARFANTPAGFTQWQGRVSAAVAEQNAHAVVVVLEPAGGYELALAGFAAAQGSLVSRPNAMRVHDWANSQGRRAKGDRPDARILARYGAAQPLAAWKPLPRVYSELESLLQRQDDLESMLQQERNRQAALELQAGTASVVAASLAAVLLSLEQTQREIRAAIQAPLKAIPR